MSAVRFLLARHARTAWLLLALAGAMRLLVPAGFMPSVEGGSVGLIVCTGMAPAAAAPMPAMAHGAGHAMPGMAHGDRNDGDAPAKSDTVCPFAALSLLGLAGADAVALALPPSPAVAPAPVRRPAAAPLAVAAYLRPPSQGPPRTA